MTAGLPGSPRLHTPRGSPDRRCPEGVCKMSFRGKLLQGDQVTLDDVVGTIQHRSGPTGIPSFSGAFVVPSGHLVPGSYQLQLHDGRTADIVISRVSQTSQGEVA